MAESKEITCPHCNEKTEGRLNNRKQLRCTACWGILPSQPTTKLGPDNPAEAEATTPAQVPLDDPDLQAAIKAQNTPPAKKAGR